MLKIKDGVNLKELEKFGFIRLFTGTWVYFIDELNVFKITDTRDIIIASCNIMPTTFENIDVIFDLIQAGLIEKVEE